MRHKVLVTAPDYDIITRYLSVWSQKVVDSFESGSHDFVVLKNNDVTRKNLESRIQSNDFGTILLNGHGASDRVTGYNREPIVDTGNIKRLKGSEIYALSCKSARELGPYSIASGVRGYVGYAENFVMVSNYHNVSKPEDDSTAALFLDPSNIIATSLCKGNGVAESTARGKRAFRDSIRKALNSDTQSDDDKYIPWLLQDMSSLTYFEK
jgi:hypothetical protein